MLILLPCKRQNKVALETVFCTGTSERSADDIWATAQDFVSAWHPMVDWIKAEPVQDGRIIRRFGAKDDSAVMREQLTYLSHSDRRFAYKALEGIAGAARYEARLSVEPLAMGAALTWEAEIEAESVRAQEIATGTAMVFEAGIAALGTLPRPKPHRATLPKPFSLSQVTIENAAPLALNVSPGGTAQADTLCLFLHGIGGNRSNWDMQLGALGAMMPMASLDLRGYGDSGLGSGQTQLQDYFSDIRAVMAHFKAKKLILCGLSYGAWIAASFALHHPSIIDGLVLCGGCTGMSEADESTRTAFRTAREGPLDAGKTPADFADAVVDVIAGPNASASTRDALFASMAAIPSDTYRDALACFTNPPATLDLAKARFPVLMMTGTHDRLAPVAEIRSVSERIAQSGAPFVQFEEIEGAGHVCNLEAPDQVNGHLATFLATFGPKRPSPKSTKRAAKHARILDAALQEFSTNGYSGASMQAIADRAEVSKPTVYQYIGQKEDVFRAVLEQGRSTILAPFANADGASLVTVLWRFAWSYADYVLRPDTLAISRLMIGEATRVPDVVRQYQQTGPAQVLGGIIDYLEAQTQTGHLRMDRPEEAAEHLWSLILSGPRNHALHFPQDRIEQAVLEASIRGGLRVFLTSYAASPDIALKALGQLAAGPPN